MKVVGLKKVDYIRKDDKRHIEGVEIHYTYTSKNITGEGVDRAFIGNGLLEENGGVLPNIGDNVQFSYNRFGKIAGFEIM